MSDEVQAIAATPLPDTDWNIVQQRYINGDPLDDIAADNNTTPRAIATRAWRYHWKAQQFKLLEDNRKDVEREVKGCLLVSVLKEARAFQREDISANPVERDLFGRCRARLYDTAAKLFGWDADPLAKTKQVKAIDV